MLNKETILRANDLFARDPVMQTLNLTIVALIEIRESIDKYVEQRITSDKVLEGLLKDIHFAIKERGQNETDQADSG